MPDPRRHRRIGHARQLTRRQHCAGTGPAACRFRRDAGRRGRLARNRPQHPGGKAGGRSAVPARPSAEPWRDWTSDTASSTAAPVDYVAQTVLAAVAGLSGAGAAVRITPAWCEPLVLWQATSASRPPASPPPSRRCAGCSAPSRKSDARSTTSAGSVTPSRPRRPARAKLSRPRRSSPPMPPSNSIAEVVSGNPRGVILWRDAPSAWLAGPERRTGCKGGMPAPSRSSDNRASRRCTWKASRSACWPRCSPTG